MGSSTGTPVTESRRDQLLAEAARLFAVRGFHGVSLTEIGAAAGVSGPAIYKHFASKDAVLAQILVGISDELLTGAQEVRRAGGSPQQTLDRLVDRHLEFALSRPELIRVHDRDLANLSAPEARRVRRLQREYVEIWVGVLCDRYPDLPVPDARASMHALFGLLNSTPHSAAGTGVAHARELLRAMAAAALTAAGSPLDVGRPVGRLGSGTR